MKRKIVFSADAGLLYEDRYGGWIATLKEAIEAPEGARYVNPPWSWVPFLLYHGVEVETPQLFHSTDVLLTDAFGLWEKARATGQERELVEMASALRPELSDCLWQADCVWRIRWRNHTHRYDAGIPYRWRVMTRTKEHFSLVEYGKVVVYSDFYADAVRLGLMDIGQVHKARFPVAEAGAHTLGEAGYANLLSEPLLAALKEAFQ